MWNDAHQYFMSPVAIAFWGTSVLADVVFAFAFARIRQTEVVLPDGRKVAGDQTSKQAPFQR